MTITETRVATAGAELLQLFQFESESTAQSTYRRRFGRPDDAPHRCFVSVDRDSWELGLASCRAVAPT